MSRTIRRKTGYKFWEDRSRYHDRIFFGRFGISKLENTDFHEWIEQEMKADKIHYQSDAGISHNHLKGALKKCFHARSRGYERKQIKKIMKESRFEDMDYDMSEELYATKGLIWAFY